MAYSGGPDFGSEVHHYFTIGDLAEIPHSGNCNTVSTENAELSDSKLIIQPNPNTGEFYLQLNEVHIQNAQLTIQVKSYINLTWVILTVLLIKTLTYVLLRKGCIW